MIIVALICTSGPAVAVIC